MERVFSVRIAAMAGGALAAWWGVKHQERVVRALRAYFFTPTVPENLALARMFVFGVLFEQAVRSPILWYVTVPDQFRTLRYGWEWLERAMPAIYATMPAAKVVLIVTAALGTIGLFTRVVTPIASVLAVFVFGIPAFYFKVNHDLHGQVLVAMTLAVSPCGDALSVDALLRKRRALPRFGRSVAYTIPVRFAWLIIGTMYLFPGLWKLWESGDLWIDGSALQDILYGQYGALPDFHPIVRTERWRPLMAFMGTATLVVEIGYFFAMFHRTARVAIAIGAAVFHFGVGLTLDIWFDSFFPLLPLLDIPELFERERVRPLAQRIPWLRSLMERYPSMTDSRAYAMPKDSGAAPFFVGSLWILAMSVAGLTIINSFPIGCYPRFAGRGRHFNDPVPETAPLNEVAVRQADGHEDRITENELLPLFRTSGFLIDQIADAKKRKDGKRLERGEALLSRVIRENQPALVKDGALVVLYRSTYLVDPDARKTATPERSEIVTWDLKD